MLKNLINLTEPDLDIKIYRIFEYKWLKEMFEEKKMALVKPKEWDDPFENFILRSGGTNDKNESFTINFWDDFFGLCWTLTPESDAMWRIYSPKHEYSKIEDKVIAKREGVKVETTIRKLFTSFYSTGGEFASISNFIGKVEYHKKEELVRMLEDSELMKSMIMDSSMFGQASTFMFKRLAFKHEKEVRLIYAYPNKPVPEKLYKFSINPNDLFDQIVFDPQIELKEFEKRREELKKLGFNKKIIKSGLYDLPQLKLNI